ncbi:MAG: hypothetical protein ACLQLC_10705 [Candidatus Sulfotelmatobacter sp.]
MATHRVRHEMEDDPPSVSTSICDSFSAELGAAVTFTGVLGTQSITQQGNYWPFCGANGAALGPPINFPLAANTTIHIKSSGLNVGTTYPYNVSQACPQGIQKGVTIIN